MLDHQEGTILPLFFLLIEALGRASVEQARAANTTRHVCDEGKGSRWYGANKWIYLFYIKGCQHNKTRLR